MAGIAVGYALGRPVEGLKAVPDTYSDEMIVRSVLLLYSDDTVLSIAFAESLLDCGRCDGDDMPPTFYHLVDQCHPRIGLIGRDYRRRGWEPRPLLSPPQDGRTWFPSEFVL